MKLRLNKTERYSVAQFSKDYQFNQSLEGFKSVTWTADECSVVALSEELNTTEAMTVEEGWQLLQITGVLDFSLVGILTQVANPLAEAGISIFTMSTYNTDYVLVKAVEMEKSIRVLIEAGHQIEVV